ncbi:MAG: glucohydrolase [Clostridia bacterium]|nr:glucohydrolase [Clostridia bacterium]
MENIWWKNAVGYQIYIRSFADSNNDGIGDIKGITQKLDYIKSIGVNFIWICPFYDSPMDDNGYDVRNYYKIDKMYGKMDDLKKLIAEAHARDIKVVIDLVLNHTSDENVWFVKSEKKIAPYTDFYVWRDGKMVDGKMCPPNNWTSFFSGPAWKYSEKRKQYYLKIFSNKMPDINYEDETAFSEMEKVIDFYGDLEVDGFRVDAIAHIGKDLTFSDAKNLKKTYKSFSNLPNTHDYLKRFNKTFTKNNMVTMGELGGDPSKKDLIRYTTEKELDMIFSFEQMSVFNKKHTINVNELFKTLKYKENLSSKNGWSVLFWLNHDYPRLISKIRDVSDPKNAQIALAGLMYMLKGTPIIYNGEEIGMENYNFKKPSDFKDVNAKMIFDNAKDINAAFENLKETSRDHGRTIMQWDATKNAGFCKSAKPWTYVNSNYKKCNVEKSIADPNSILNHYSKLMSVRNEYGNDLVTANYKFYKHGKVLGYKIMCDGYELEVVANLSNKEKKFKLNEGEIIYSNMAGLDTIKSYQFAVIKRNK